MEIIQVTQKVNLVDGCYTPSDASSLVTRLVEEKIKFLKLQNLKNFIHDSSCDCRPSEERVIELKQELQELKEIVSQSRIKGREIKINCVLEITYDE
ncbi:MAG: hypothetical protein ACI9FN_002972 [Saprospiraceae bacterium]|jgi:hypothetical protein